MLRKRVFVAAVGLLFFAFLANSRSRQQEAGSKGIQTTIVASRQSVLPYEPLSVLLLLRNDTAEDKRVVASWRSFLAIGEVTPDGIKWRDYLADNEPMPRPPLPSAKNLAPGKVEKQRAHIDYEAPSGEHVFANPGRYLLKGVASQGPASDGGRFMSDEIEITVRTPQGVDAKAYEFLRKSYLHHFFGEYTVHKYQYDHKTVDDMERFIADFDGSEYSNIARMGLAFMWLRGVEGRQDRARAVDLLTQVADRAGYPLSSAAEYHLGVILSDPQSKAAQADSHFRKVLSGTPSPYFRYLAEEAVRQR